MVNKIEGQLNIGSFDLGPTGSIQFQFAKLQLLLAETSKGRAKDYMQSITSAQEQSRELSQIIEQCRTLQNKAKENKGGGYYDSSTQGALVDEKGALVTKTEDVNKRKETLAAEYVEKEALSAEKAKEKANKDIVSMKNDQTAMPADIKAYMEKNGLTVSAANDGKFFDADQWEITIKSLRSHQEQMGTDTQQKMVFVQDFMGQYNSYLQGASTSIQQSNQVLSTISRGQ